MIFLILGALAVPVALGVAGVLPGFVVLVVEVGVLLTAAWLFDRGRAVGARAPFLDENRSDIAAPMADHSMYVAKETVERPADRPTAD